MFPKHVETHYVQRRSPGRGAPTCNVLLLLLQASQDGSRGFEDEEIGGPGLDDYEPVPDDNPEHNAYAGSQDGLSEEGVTAQEDDEEGEELFGDNFMRCVLQQLQ